MHSASPCAVRLAFALLAVAAVGCSPGEPPPSRAEIERGGYLAERVAGCVACHSPRDWTMFSGPVRPGREGTGGRVDVFGSHRETPPITARALAGRSTAEIAAAARGTGFDGAPIHRDRASRGLAALTAADARAIAGWLAAGMPPVPGPGRPLAASPPWAGRSVDAGGYLVAIGRCRACHGEDLAGGLRVAVPHGDSHLSANLTPDPAGIAGRMSREEMIAYFKSLDDPRLARVPVPEGELNTAMPWPRLAGMAEEDLGAIHDYLRTVPAAQTPPAPSE